MKKIGYIAAIIGALLALTSFGFDTAPEGTHNIGLMQTQMMTFECGALLAVIGTLLTVFGIGLERMERAGLLPPAGYKAPDVAPGEKR